MKNPKILYYFSNFLIIVSIVGLLYTFYPIIKIYIFPPLTQPVKPAISEGTTIAIPKIHAYAPIVEKVDPWNEKIYNEALKKGVAHAKGSALPGTRGTIYLFAHSSGSPWEISRYNTIFFRLGELQKNDIIFLRYKKKDYRFLVFDKKEVWPNETEFLENLDKDQLIVQTCTPIGTSLKRLLIFAKQE